MRYDRTLAMLGTIAAALLVSDRGSRRPVTHADEHARRSGPLDAPVTITPDKPVRLRYGLWIHPAVPDAKKLDQQWQTFASRELAPMTAIPR